MTRIGTALSRMSNGVRGGLKLDIRKGPSKKEFSKKATGLMEGVGDQGTPGASLVLGTDDIVTSGAKFEKMDGILDIHMHGNKGGGLFVKQNGEKIEISVTDLAEYIKSEFPNVGGIRCFACDGTKAAKTLANKTGKPVLAADDKIHVDLATGKMSTPGDLHRIDPN